MLAIPKSLVLVKVRCPNGQQTISLYAREHKARAGRVIPMANQPLELYLHGQSSKPRVVTADANEVLRDVLVRNAVIAEQAGDRGLLIFVGECEEAIAEDEAVENGNDTHAPVDITLTVEVLELKRHRHVHFHQCRYVAVSVNFNGATKQRKFSPATTVGIVARSARKKFRLDPVAAAEYVLRICKSTEQPRADKHLGELVKPTECSICFDLVKEVTPQG
jgi:hypothetical protein